MRGLDLFCGVGGCSVGYSRAGFAMTGIDICWQPDYPYKFMQANAMDVLDDLAFLRQFDFIHASPPCQRYTKAQRIQGRAHPDLVPPVRKALYDSGVPYVIENLGQARMVNRVELCGTMFGIRTYRHRKFEFRPGIRIPQPEHPEHVAPVAKMGRPVGEDEFMHIVGNFTDTRLARQIMGIDWTRSRRSVAEAIPPCYTEYLGTKLLEAM